MTNEQDAGAVDETSAKPVRRRPNPWQWLLYAYGRKMPAELHEWVLWDVTARGWVFRHLARATAQIAPILVLGVIFLPGPPSLIVAMCAGGAAIGYIFSFAAIVESNEYRLVKAGYEQGTGEATRAARALTKQRATAAALRQRREQAATRRAHRAR
jgi:hypothetical protein